MCFYNQRMSSSYSSLRDIDCAVVQWNNVANITIQRYAMKPVDVDIPPSHWNVCIQLDVFQVCRELNMHEMLTNIENNWIELASIP